MQCHLKNIYAKSKESKVIFQKHWNYSWLAVRDYKLEIGWELSSQGKKKHRDRYRANPMGRKRQRLELRDLQLQLELQWEGSTSQGTPTTAGSHRRPGELGWAKGRVRLPGSSCCFLRGGGGAFMSSWLLPTLLKTPALCLPVHHVQETNNNSKRSFSKVSTPPPKPGLDLLSSILNRLPFHAKLAIQDVWLTSPHYLGLS